MSRPVDTYTHIHIYSNTEYTYIRILYISYINIFVASSVDIKTQYSSILFH